MVLQNGSIANVDEIYNSIVGPMFSNFSQNLFNSAYIGFNSKLNVATGVPNLKNIKYDCMLTDTATTNYGFLYDSTNKNYKTPDAYVIIEANDATLSWSSNNCVLTKIASGKWILYSTSSGIEVQRAEIHKSLWYGTTGSDQLIEDFTSITAIKTNITRDIGKRGYFVYETLTFANSSREYNGQFSDTTTNLNCSSWTNLTKYNVTSNEIGLDKATDEYNNPTNFRISLYTYANTGGGTIWELPTGTILNEAKSGNSTMSSTIYLILLTSGTISYSGGSGTPTGTIKNFSTIPTFSAFSDGDADTTLIFQTTDLDTITDCIATWNSLIDSDNTLTVSISADGTNYETVTDATIHRFTNTGTNLYVKFEIDRVDTSAVDKISEYAVLYNLGAS